VLYVWIGAALIGLTLGLLGSGGSILTVPVLVYLAGEPAKAAIAESLAIVGAIALVGAVPYAVQRSVDWRSALFFGVPGVAGTYLGAALSAYVSAPLQLALFAVVMLLAAVLMLRGRPAPSEADPARRHAAALIAVEGLAVGIVTGLVGVGGGFLIVPALVLLGGLPMRLAVGTSLLIIAVKSFAGFWKYLDVLAAEGLAVNWELIGLLTAIGIVGSFAGNLVSQRVPQRALRHGFAGFLIVMGAFILWQEGPAALGLKPEAPPPSARTAPILESSTPTPYPMFSFLRSRQPATPVQIPADAAILDVRTPAEFADGRLRSALHADVMAPDFRQRIEALGLDPAQPVYVYCRSGNRSARAASILREMGYAHAENIGGLDALIGAGFDAERGAP
jgi:uncharacterized protein